jgi:hypothetical protein
MRTHRADATVLTGLFLASSVGAPIAAQSTETAALRVRVTDAATGLPISGAQVGFPALALFRLASSAGVAQIVGIPLGTHVLEATMLGYGKATQTLILEAHAVATGVIALTTEPIEIEGLTVTASQDIKRLRDAGFYNREQLGFGYHLGPLEIASRSRTAFNVIDYFAMVPNVRVIQAGPGRYQVESRRSCVTLSSFAPPPSSNPRTRMLPPMPANPHGMAIYLDGAPYGDGLDHLPVDMIQAIEVYVGVEVPLQFSTGRRGACGVILLWSKW